MLKDLSAAKIKVVGPEGGFINSFMQIQTIRGPLVVRIVVNSVDVASYNIYEKRSYAQVVVDGAEGCSWMRAGIVNRQLTWTGRQRSERIKILKKISGMEEFRKGVISSHHRR